MVDRFDLASWAEEASRMFSPDNGIGQKLKEIATHLRAQPLEKPTDDDMTCSNCGEPCPRHYYVCRKESKVFHCPSCFIATECFAGEHGDGCPICIVTAPVRMRLPT